MARPAGWRTAAATTLSLLLVLGPVAAQAQSLSASLTAPSSIPAGQSSTLVFSVTYTNGNSLHPALHEVDFALPPGYAVTSVAGPSAGWAGSTSTSGNTTTVSFLTSCANAGLAAGGSASFQIVATAPSASSEWSGPVTVSGKSVYTSGGAQTYCEGNWEGAVWYIGTSVPFSLELLQVTGSASPANLLGAGLSSTITWTVKNCSSDKQTVALARAPSASSGWTESCTGSFTAASINAGATRTVACTYAFSAAGTYTFTATASATGSSTQTGAVSIQVGAVTAGWDHSAVVVGRAGTLTVTNASLATITRVDVKNALSGGLVVESASATNGLSYVSGSSSSADAVFTGTLAAGASSTLAIKYSAASLSTTTSCAFTVTLTPSDGSSYALSLASQTYPLVVPIADVSGLTILASSKGQTLAWTNTPTSGSTHDGVVIFRTASGTAPGAPTDFTAYTTSSSNVVYADSGSSSVSTFTDSTVGSYNYRVCSRDAYYVYSSCSTGFWNSGGWLDSEVYPSGGWVHAVGLQAVLKPGLLSGNRVGVASNIPSVAVLDTATGAREFAPVTIPSIPSATTPAATLANGNLILFAADQSGNITAINLATGDVYWKVTKTGESFTAGVSGVTRASASAAFQAAYSMDILLLGSTTTGKVYAIDATSGATLWAVSAGSTTAGVYGLITYDPLTDIFYVPTAGLGVKAYSLAASSPTVAAVLASTWTNPEAVGIYKVACVRTAASAGVACVNSSGVLRVMNKTTGALQASAFTTAIASPTALARVSGSAATSGLVVASASTIQVISATGTPYALASLGTWTPGVTISTPSVYADSGYLVVGGSDKRLHRVLLSNATQATQSPVVTTQATSLLTGQPVFDTTSSLYIFGTSDGHVWALPSF